MMGRNIKISVDALDPHSSGFGFPIRFPSVDPIELLLHNLRHFISERHGVLEDGWHFEFKQPFHDYHLCVVYCAPNGKTFCSIQDVAFYLGLAVNDSYSRMDADIRNESSLLQENLHMPKKRKTSIWLNNGFPEQKGSSRSAQLRRFSIRGQTMIPFTVSSGTRFQAGESSSSENIGCGCEEANVSVNFKSLLVLPQVDFHKTLSYIQENGVDIGDIVVEEDPLPIVWKKVSQKLVDACSNVLKQKRTMNFRCKHGDRETREINWDMINETDSVVLYLTRFYSSLAPHSATCGETDNSEIATLIGALSTWLDQSRFGGLDADFVQVLIERIPGADSCSNYRFLKSRSSSFSVPVAEGALVVEPKGGENVKCKGRSFW